MTYIVNVINPNVIQLLVNNGFNHNGKLAIGDKEAYQFIGDDSLKEAMDRYAIIGVDFYCENKLFFGGV